MKDHPVKTLLVHLLLNHKHRTEINLDQASSDYYYFFTFASMGFYKAPLSILIHVLKSLATPDIHTDG